MRSALLEFERALRDLRSLLERNRLEEQILSLSSTDQLPADLDSLLQSYRTCVEPFSLRRAQYATQLILLYGAFERFIEGLIIGFADTLTALVPEFRQLPQRITENHRRKSLDALRDEVWLNRQPDRKTASRLIENLSSCENQQANFALNSLAYARHNANYRKSLIDESFRELGVTDLCLKAKTNDHFKDYLAQQPRSAGLLDETLAAIDDLAERRNEIGHGSPSQLLSLDELDVYLEFFGAYARSAFIVLRQHMAQFVVAHHALFLGKLDKVHYHKVACFDTGVLPEGTLIETGDLIALRISGSLGFELGEIVKIRLESGDTNSVFSQPGLSACIETAVRLRKGQDIFLVDKHNQSAMALARQLPRLEA